MLKLNLDLTLCLKNSNILLFWSFVFPPKQIPDDFLHFQVYDILTHHVSGFLVHHNWIFFFFLQL